MSDTDTTAAVKDAPSSDKAPSTELVEVQVIAAGFSYFVKNAVLGPDGEQLENPQSGKPEFVTLRHEATMGDLIKVAPYTAAVALRDGFVREPSSDPLLPPRRATPFTQPIADENGEVRGFEGPIMGDPRASTAEDHGQAADRMPLTAEQIAELQSREDERAAVDPFSVDEATDDELEEKVASLNVDETLALAKGPDGSYDEQRAARVLEAELSRDNPRSTVVEPLEKIG
jgi:hypothetical protein